ncbi:bifunctional 3'-5' exonuclease/DNA polymerase [Leifsonia sp. YAF41]|uniref:bifunctional 3'-5' exonuclease/DNA polymerase n=1 Tax=Leifsonia sp. YAF41 TaxID=3233086 RepID=UPI003F9D7A2B
MYRVVSESGSGGVLVQSVELTADGVAPSAAPQTLTEAEFHAYVLDEEPDATRWVWDDTARWYPGLLRAGIRVQRAHDLRLSHAILRNSELTADSGLARAAPTQWDGASAIADASAVAPATLFDFFASEPGSSDSDDSESAGGDALAEFTRQMDAVATSAEPAGLRLLLAAESVGALIAAEMQFAGLPWRTDIHAQLLTAELGPRVPYGTRPSRLEQLAGQIRTALGDPVLNPDSPQDVLKSLQRAGLRVTSTRAWELQELTHPVIAPLLEYKKRSRLLTANGWYWMDTWIVDGRFRPDYVPGGVVTGRWAAKGGGALQLPKQVRGAVVADDGWKLVVADAAQLEPRILAALSRDMAMADAGRGTDLYAGIVARGVVETRDQAKIAMLGAMYGATSGESGRLLPSLAKAYPRALALTEAAARAGERGDVVSTRLGRSSPRPGERWLATQAQAYDPAASSTDERRARSEARDWGRFTRNFIVQGSAAEWALCWMAEIRKALLVLGVQHPQPESTGAAAGPFSEAPHLVFFLHDEVIVHAPAERVEQVVALIHEAAARAGRLLFGEFPVDFPLTVAVVDSYADAK